MNWRSCADIKIVASPSSSSATATATSASTPVVYKPDPVPKPAAYPLTFQCEAWGGMGCFFIGDACYNISQSKNTRPDPLQFKGDGVSCLVPIPHTGFNGTSIDPNCKNCSTFVNDCQTCRQLCMSPASLS
jgi:hypothetical protein